MLSHLAILASVLTTVVHGYDIGCLYPEEMPHPIKARNDFVLSQTVQLVGAGLETPIAVYNSHHHHQCESNCLAFHDDKSLNVLTMERPIFSTPPEYFNSWSRFLCMLQCYPTKNDPLFKEWNFQRLPLNAELVACSGDAECLELIAIEQDYDPRIIGQIVMLEIDEYHDTDGWNSKGTLTYDHKTGAPTECTANCAPFSDTTGYFPRNHPKYFDTPPTVLTGNDIYWQPLVEVTNQGSFVRQDHVTPHIGYTAHPLLLSEFKETADPGYDYLAESVLLLQRLADLTGDNVRQEKIKFYDNKLAVRHLIQFSFIDEVPELTFEDFLMFLIGISSVEHDAVVSCWREKVRHDRVRPTTVVQTQNDIIVDTFNPAPGATTPASIAARDFVPYIRTMPHSEYPSGSAAICTGYADFTDLFTTEYFGVKLDLFEVNDVEHDFCKNYGVACTASFSVDGTTELAEECGESRLWSGVHFGASIPAGKELGDGLGELGLEFVKTVKAGTNWTSTTTASSYTRPVCGM